MSAFNTLASPVEGIYREKGSKFLAFAFPVSSVEDAEDAIREIKKIYHDSKHVCFAWRIGVRAEHSRAFDAGEPAHSAGTPILNEIRSYGLSNIILIVVRYFGGTKLGIPGLIEAYREASRDALDKAQLPPVKDLKNLSIRFPYEQTAEIRRILHKYSPETISEEFSAECRFILSFNADIFYEIENIFREKGILE